MSITASAYARQAQDAQIGVPSGGGSIQSAANATERTPDAAGRADRMLKGLRDRGDVRVGAPVTKSISVVFDVAEPRFVDVPDWLDPGVADDRLVASALLLQASMPSSAVVLLTSDLNLQNKAAALGLPYVEPPPA